MTRLIKMRLDRGLSVSQAAQQIGVAQRTLSRAESGEGIHPASMKLIADFYYVRVTDLWPVADRSAA